MILDIILITLAVIAGLFLLTIVIYFFNLDMKLAASLTPVMNKFYDYKKKKAKAKQNKDK